jgi:hypothetical protein
MDEKIKIDRKSIKVRKEFPPDFDPATKIISPKKSTYKRSDTRREIEDALKEMEEDQNFEI